MTFASLYCVTVAARMVAESARPVAAAASRNGLFDDDEEEDLFAAVAAGTTTKATTTAAVKPADTDKKGLLRLCFV